MTATHAARGSHEPTGEKLAWRNAIFFPWDPAARKFKGEIVYTDLRLDEAAQHLALVARRRRGRRRGSPPRRASAPRRARPLRTRPAAARSRRAASGRERVPEEGRHVELGLAEHRLRVDRDVAAAGVEQVVVVQVAVDERGPADLERRRRARARAAGARVPLRSASSSQRGTWSPIQRNGSAAGRQRRRPTSTAAAVASSSGRPEGSFPGRARSSSSARRARSRRSRRTAPSPPQSSSASPSSSDSSSSGGVTFSTASGPAGATNE